MRWLWLCWRPASLRTTFQTDAGPTPLLGAEVCRAVTCYTGFIKNSGLGIDGAWRG